MRRLLAVASILILAGTQGSAADCPPSSGPAARIIPAAAPRVVPGDLILKFRPEASRARTEEVIRQIGGPAVVHVRLVDGADLLRINVVDTEKFAEQLNAREDLKDVLLYAAANHFVYALQTISDPLFPCQCGMTAINAEKGWAAFSGAANVLIGVLDTGVNEHDDLKGFVGQPVMADVDKHGTHVAGIVGAVANGKGVVGVTGTTTLVKVRSFPFLDANGIGQEKDAVKAIHDAIAAGATVLTASWGFGGAEPKYLLDAIKLLDTNNIVIVVAAGNDANDIAVNGHAVYPAAFQVNSVISVMATTCEGRRARFSNHSKTLVHIGAPGEGMTPGTGILSTIRLTDYVDYSGTSMSVGFVAGAAALIKSEHPGWSPSDIRKKLISSSKSLAKECGQQANEQCAVGGQLDLEAALK